MSTQNNTHKTSPHTSMKHQLPPATTTVSSCSQEAVGGENQAKRSTGCSQSRNESCTTEAAAATAVEDCGRERLKRHRVEVAGQVWIPEIWGKEELLKDWADCCGFDAYWMNTNIILARTALVEETRSHSHSTTFRRIDNTC